MRVTVYKFIVSQCVWVPREIADSGHDLKVSQVKLFTNKKEIFDNVWSPGLGNEYRSVELVFWITDDSKIELTEVTGCIPGRVATSNYDLAAKIDRVRNDVIASVVVMLLQEKCERSID